MSNELDKILFGFTDKMLELEKSFEVSAEEIESLKKYGMLKNTEEGGLITGDEFTPMISKTANGYHFHLVQSYRFLLSHGASEYLGLENANIINARFGEDEDFEPYEVPEHIQRLEPGWIIVEGNKYKQFLFCDCFQLLMSRNATLFALDDLNDSNTITNFYNVTNNN